VGNPTRSPTKGSTKSPARESTRKSKKGLQGSWQENPTREVQRGSPKGKKHKSLSVKGNVGLDRKLHIEKKIEGKRSRLG